MVAMAIAGMDVCDVDSDSSDGDNGSERRSRLINNNNNNRISIAPYGRNFRGAELENLC